MIINIRGTSGSGKTTVVRKIMNSAGEEQLHHIEGRKRPLAHVFPDLNLVVMGSYETTCGGCDTISKFDDCYETICKFSKEGRDVIYEGLRQSSDVKRIKWLKKQGCEVVAITLTTSLEECLEAVRQRRLARGNTKPLNPENTTSKFKGILRADKRLDSIGVTVHRVSREAAVEKLVELLEL